MPIVVEPATPADDAAIRGLLQREPVPGRISLTYEREPDFAPGCRVTGDNCHVLLARDTASGQVVGVACRSERPVFVNGQEQRLGYLGQLRIDRRYRGRWLVAQGFARLRELHVREPVAAYLAAIVDGSREATGVLVTKRRRHFPMFHPVSDYRTLALQVRGGGVGRSASDVHVQPLSTGDLGHVAQFLTTHGVGRQFFPVWSEERLRELVTSLDLRVGDIRVATRDGRIAGVLGVWDQSAYKQFVVQRYHGWLRLAAPVYNVGAPLVGRRPLPAPGQRLRSAYLSLACVAGDDRGIFEALMANVYETAQRRSYRCTAARDGSA